MEHFVSRLLDKHGGDNPGLDGYQNQTNDNLSTTGHETWLLSDNSFLGSGQDTRNPIGLGDERRVHDGETEAGQHSRHETCHFGRLGDQYERGAMAKKHSDHNCIRKFSCWCLHDWRVVMFDEHNHGEEGHDDAGAGDGDGHQRGRVRPFQEFNWDLIAAYY